MRKVILSMMVSLDNFIEPTNPEEEWAVWDDEMTKYIMDFFNEVDTFLYGRVAYESMLDYWPKATGEFADIMNKTPKLVFSRTLNKADWNANIINGNIKDKITQIKMQPGKNLVLFAGTDIASAFINLDLIDEYRIIVNPLILGGGKPLFQNIKSRQNLKLINIKRFTCGNVILYYEPVQQQ